MRLALATVLSLLLGAGARAQADPHAAGKQVLLLMPEEPSPAARTLPGAVRAHTMDLDVRVRQMPRPPGAQRLEARIEAASRLASEHGALGSFWVDEQADGWIALALFDAQAERVLVRRFGGPGSAKAAVVEEIALAVRSLSRALGQGRRIGMQPVEPPAEEPAPHRGRLRIGSGYGGVHLGVGPGWQHGASITAAYRPIAELFVRAGYMLVLPFSVTDGGVRARIRRFPFSLAAGYTVHFGDFELSPELGLVAAWTHRSTLRTPPGLEASPDRDEWGVALTPAARFGWTPWERVGLYVRAGVDVWLRRVRYGVAAPDFQSFASPRRVRVRAGAGMWVDLW
jgi:hypothetical protein